MLPYPQPLPLGEVALHIPPQLFWGQHKAGPSLQVSEKWLVLTAQSVTAWHQVSIPDL